MRKIPTYSQIEYSSSQRNRQIRRILLLLLIIVMLSLTGMLINGRVMGQGPQTPVPAFDEPILIPYHDLDSIPVTEDTQVFPTQTVSASLDSFDQFIQPTTSIEGLPPQDVASKTPTLTSTLELQQTIKPTPQVSESPEAGTVFLSIDEDGYKHLFAYHPQTLPFTRLTNGNWDDISPSINPDGTRLAFASNRSGYWDIYILDLISGQTSRLTETPAYDGSPSWSPDSHWLVYESYSSSISDEGSDLNDSGIAANLDIFIHQLDIDDPNTEDPIRLTNHPGVDYAPAWSPTGRRIVFVSNRSGASDIWLADLDQIEDRFINISQNSGSSDTYPTWSPDGNLLAWAAAAGGYQNIFIYNLENDQSLPQMVGAGNHPEWSPSGNKLITSILAPNQTYLTGYQTDSPGLALPPIPLIGSLAGLTWSKFSLPDPRPSSLVKIAEANPTPAWQVSLTTAKGIPGERRHVVPISDIEAPYPMLQDMTDESFVALRDALAKKIGWDYLSSLENAYVPLTSPLSPGMLEDWLYTGRAIAVNPVVINAGWMVLIREDYGSETYWRVYLRTRFQDGSQGKPLFDFPWDLNTRYSGDPRSYEQGGTHASNIPPGYWLDFTELAASYGWERLPALSTWRSAIPSARYNEFVRTDGLDWLTAMLEIYPPEAINTSQVINSPY